MTGPGTTPLSPLDEDRRLGELLVQLGLVAADEVERALAEEERHADSGTPVRLAGLLAARGALNADRLRALLQPTSSAATVIAQPAAPDPGSAETVVAASSAAGARAATAAATAAVPGGDGARAPGPDGTPFGRYRLLDSLGAGGMGVVWKAWDTDLRRVVALKQIRPEGVDSEAARARFVREARLAAKLHHPNVVAVHDVGTIAQRDYITMDFIAGRTLADYLAETRAARRAGGRGSMERLRHEVRILADVAAAVAYAHGEGVVHRDLKPTNVLLDASEHAYVMDFGLAKEVLAEAAPGARAAATQISLSGQALGTPAYMSPEQAAGDSGRVGPPSDVWALGVILYETLTGAIPFDGPDALRMLAAVIKEDPAPPRRRNAHVPPELEAICLKALEKGPGGRYATAREFAQELERWLRGEPVQAKSPTPAYRAWRWVARRRAIVLPATAAVVLLAAALAWGWHERARSANRDRAILQRIAASVGEFQDLVMRVEMPPAASAAVARQPLELLDTLIAETPDFGPAWSWRGEVRATLGREREAQADFDRGCTLSPGFAIVWFLRGRHRIEAYGRLRGLPSMRMGASGVEFAPASPESPEERALREAGMADLERMAPTRIADESFGEDDTRLAQALVAYHAASADGYQKVLAQLEGRSSPRAGRLRGGALYYLKRFEPAIAALGKVLETWPLDGETRGMRALARHAAGLAELRAGSDPRPTLRAAVADYDEAARLLPVKRGLRANRAVAWSCLGEAEVEAGGDPCPAFRSALADLDIGLQEDARDLAARVNRAIVRARLGQALAVRGQDPTSSCREALADCDQAEALAPEDAGVAHARAKVFFILARAEAARGGDPRENYRRAIDGFSVTLRRDPGSALAFCNRATTTLDLLEAEGGRAPDGRERCQSALADCEEAVRLDPAYVDSYNCRATAWLALGEQQAAHGEDPRAAFRQAVADADETLRRDPGHPKAHANRGAAWWGLGHADAVRGENPAPSFRTAVADFAAALRGRGVTAEMYDSCGSVHLQLAARAAARGEDASDDFRSAEAAFLAAAERRLGQAMLNLGLVLRATGHYEEAVRAFEDAARKVPGRRDFATGRAAETRALLACRDEPWVRDMVLARLAAEVPDYAAAGPLFERALAAHAAALAGLAPDERSRRQQDPELQRILARAHYHLACIEALASAGRAAPAAAPAPVDEAACRTLRDRACAHLAEAVRCGWDKLDAIRTDPELAPIKDDPRFEAALAGRR